VLLFYILFSSHAWNEISDEEKQKLRLKQRNDGKFWMSSDDFIRNFTEISICHQELASFEKNRASSKVRMKGIVVMSVTCLLIRMIN
jgi:hypothetical protein